MTKQLTAEDIEAAFENATPKRSRRLCRVGAIIHEYPVLEPRIMDVEHYSAKTIVRVLKNLGLGAVADTSVTKHRKGDCCCPKETEA